MLNTQGRYATNQGSILEKTIQGIFESKNFELIKYSAWVKNPSLYGTELLLKNIEYTSIYNHTARTEFLLLSRKYDVKIRIECKWQQSSGSVDEKLPYLYLNAVYSMPENDIIIVIDGNGWKKGAVEWLKSAVDNRLYTPADFNKNIKVYSISEFITWANISFR
jgi:PD-(D/E)XK nuclease superfamily domain